MDQNREVRLLYIEDEAGVAYYVKRQLDRRGCSVEIAGSGEEGVEKALAGAYDALIIDYRLPGMTGLEVLDTLRARGVAVPAILVTVLGDVRIAAEAFKRGAWDYVIKDMDGEFVNKLPTTIAQARKQQSLLAERERLHRTLEENAVRLSSILASIGDIVITIDEAGAVESVNPAVEALLGYAPDEVIGRNVSMLIPGLTVGQRTLIGDTPHEILGRRKDGSPLALDMKVTEMWLSGQRRFVGVLRDISERNLVLENLRQQSEALARSNAELEQFASVASHDLQEPLRKIRAFGDRLETRYRDVLGEQGKDYLDRMTDASRRMQELINDLLTYSRVTSRAEPFQVLDLGELVRDVVGSLQIRLEETGGRVEIGALPAIEADPRGMQQLFQNLIGNAIKFHRPEVPPIVTVEAVPGEDTIEISVSDNGIGFDEKYLDRIFRMFQRLHGRFEYPGSGIGLAICRKIVTYHGGSITARSAPDKGATFLITLPAHPPLSV
ncbi:MAG: response regulator [Alphaproteobacteria bacterium]|nr:response regulator [Alphaproteobacteria bacterium]